MQKKIIKKINDEKVNLAVETKDFSNPNVFQNRRRKIYQARERIWQSVINRH